MQHYRPTFAGIVIALTALYAASCAARWTLADQTGDGLGALVVTLALLWLAWRLDTRVVG